VKPLSLLKLLWWSLISVVFFITPSLYPVELYRMKMMLKSFLRPI
jgi:hypothetical protein